MIRFCAGGDLLQQRKLPDSYEGLQEIIDYIHSSDVRIVNLEVPILDKPVWCSSFSGFPPLSSKPFVVEDMRLFGFQACGCANNHTLDYGIEGMYSTMNILDQAHFLRAGIGRSLEEATMPTAIPTSEGDVAYIAASAVYYENDSSRAGYSHDGIPARPGMNGIRHLDECLVTSDEMKYIKDLAYRTMVNAENEVEKACGYMADQDDEGKEDGIGETFTFGNVHFRTAKSTGRFSSVNENDMARIERAVINAKRTHEYCIVSLHCHQFRARKEYEVDFYEEEFAHRVIDAGADAFLGTGTHLPKGIEIYKGKPIFYCLGNFVFQGGYCNERVSADFIETMGLSPELSGPEVYAKQNENITNSLDDGDIYFRAIVPRWELENGQLQKIELLPIYLNRTAPLGLRGFPQRTNPDKILEHMRLASEPYGTKFKANKGLIEVIL